MIAFLRDRFAVTHRLLAEAGRTASEDDLRWRAAPTAPSIAFHLWHCARWADRWAEALRSMSTAGPGAPATPQRWERDGLAARWGFPADLGGGATGMSLPDEQAAALPFPAQGELLAYLEAATTELEAALAELDDSALATAADDLLGEQAPLGDSLLRQLAHANRHLGMIEALRGIRGGHGTITR